MQNTSQSPKTRQGGALCYTGHHTKYKSVTKDQSGWGTVLHWPSRKIQVSHQRVKTSQGGALCYTGHRTKYKSVTKDQSRLGTVLHWPSRKIQVSHQRVQTSQGGASSNRHPWRQCSLYGLNLLLGNGGGSSHPCWIASMGIPDWQDVSVVDIHL